MAGKIFITSDLHFGHNKEFLWGPRGFNSIQEHDETIIKNWNSIVEPDDDVYILGDLMLNDNTHGIECLRQLKGRLHIVWGNHDTPTRQNLYDELPNIVDAGSWARVIRYRKYNFHLSHWPTDTANYDDVEKGLRASLISLSGHTHKKEKFHNGNIMKYNVALDAHNNYPVLLDNAIEDIKEYAKCLTQFNT